MTKKYSLKTVTSLSIALNRFKNNKSNEEGRKVKRDTSLDSSNSKVWIIYFGYIVCLCQLLCVFVVGDLRRT